MSFTTYDVLFSYIAYLRFSSIMHGVTCSRLLSSHSVSKPVSVCKTETGSCFLSHFNGDIVKDITSHDHCMERKNHILMLRTHLKPEIFIMYSA